MSGQGGYGPDDFSNEADNFVPAYETQEKPVADVAQGIDAAPDPAPVETEAEVAARVKMTSMMLSATIMNVMDIFLKRKGYAKTTAEEKKDYAEGLQNVFEYHPNLAHMGRWLAYINVIGMPIAIVQMRMPDDNGDAMIPPPTAPAPAAANEAPAPANEAGTFQAFGRQS